MKIVVLTGAGISADSGIPTYRSSDGLWANFKIEDVCTPEALERDRAKVINFYNMRRKPMMVALLEELNRIKPISVELGLQTIHESSARYIRRGYDTQVYHEAVEKLKKVGVEVVTHIILGLPGETMEMAAQTTRAAVEAGTDGVKFHLLHVLRGTDLEKDYLDGKFRCLELEEYAAWVKRCLDELPPHIVVHRITGDGAKKDLIAPLWSADKKRVLNYLNNYLRS